MGDALAIPMASPDRSFRLEDGQILQQRNDADDDDYDASDLLHLSVNGQHTDEIKHQHDYQEGDQDADQN